VRVQLRFGGEIWYWRGPSPYHFVWVPEAESAELDEIRDVVSYGWGVIPVRATIGGTTFTTSLFPKEGRFLVPVKDAVRKAEGLEVGEACTVELTVEPVSPR
jgi:Domain of unknown function (DUF1905)